MRFLSKKTAENIVLSEMTSQYVHTTNYIRLLWLCVYVCYSTVSMVQMVTK